MSSTIYVTWVILGSQINCQFGREVAEHGETDHLVMIDTFWEGEKKKDRGRERERERKWIVLWIGTNAINVQRNNVLIRFPFLCRSQYHSRDSFFSWGQSTI